MDYVFSEGEEPDAERPAGPAPHARSTARALERAVALLREAERPVVMAGNGLYWARGEDALRELAERLGVPVFLNGLARGCLPADHELFFARARSAGLKGADVALVIGVPMDFRLAFGGAFGEETELIVLDGAEPERDHPRPVAAELYGDVAEALPALAGAGGGADTRAWVEHLRGVETEKRAAEEARLHRRPLAAAPDAPVPRAGRRARPRRDPDRRRRRLRLLRRPGRRHLPSRAAGWTPGPFGCLGCGPGYALAAKLAHPDRQVVLLLGDGAFGFAGMEFDTLARHGVQVVAVIGNNGIWALEKHPMEFLYGYSMAAELTPETRYDQVAEALGCHGELVRAPGELRAGAGARVRRRPPGGGERAHRPRGRLPAGREPGLNAAPRADADRPRANPLK